MRQTGVWSIMSDPHDSGPRPATSDPYEGVRPPTQIVHDARHTDVKGPNDVQRPRPRQPMPAGESWNSLLFGAIIFAVAGFYFVWATVPAAQFAMWSLRGLAVGFAAAFVLLLVAPRLGASVGVIVIALAALLLCSAGVWMEIVQGGRDVFGWMLLLMGGFDAVEVMRYVRARRAMRG